MLFDTKSRTRNFAQRLSCVVVVVVFVFVCVCVCDAPFFHRTAYDSFTVVTKCKQKKTLNESFEVSSQGETHCVLIKQVDNNNIINNPSK